MLEKKKLISIDVTVGSYSDFVNHILLSASNHDSQYVCVANVHMLIEAYKSNEFKKVVNNSLITTPDGMPLAKAIKWLYRLPQDRVDGMSLLPSLIDGAIKRDISVFFYGGTNNTIEATCQYIKLNYPDLKLAGAYSPPFRALTEEEEEEIISKINSSGTHLLFTALGCPKQEKWMASMKGKLNCTMIGIGGALPVFIGQQKRAPVWMQKLSLEWFFRLIQEPRRLFKRYFNTNILFLYLLQREFLKKVIKKV